MTTPGIELGSPALLLAVMFWSAPTGGLAQTPEPPSGAPSEAEVIVEVVDRKGLPVPSADVAVEHYEPFWRAECATQSDGSCSLGLLPLASKLRLTVNDREHEYYVEWLDLISRGPRVLVRLPEPPWRMSRGSGRVIDERGEPVEGAAVTLFEMMEHVPNEWTAVTDAAGEFALERLPEGSYSVTVAADGFATAIVGMWAGDGAAPLEVELVRGATVKGTVIAPAEIGCSDATVRATQVFERDDFMSGMPFRGNPPLSAIGEIDERCAYEVAHLPPGHWRISVRVAALGPPLFDELVEIRPGQSEVIFDLEPSERAEVSRPTVWGSVTDRHTGRGLEGAEVRMGTRTRNGHGVVGGPRSTDSEGEFTFPFSPLSPTSVYLTAWRDGYTTESVQWDGSGEPVRIELSPTAGLHYRVRWFDGVDPEYVDLTLVDEAGRPVQGPRNSDSEGHWSSAPEGELVLEVSRGVIRVRVPVVIPGPELDVVIPPSGGAKLRVPELEAGFGDGWLDGVTVEARPLGALEGAPLVRDEETIHLAGLAPGPWEITMTAPDGRTWTGRGEIRLREWTVVFLR